MKFRLSQKAERELEQIFVYWAERAGMDTADRLVDLIEERFTLLGDYPSAGRRCDEIQPGLYRFPAGKYLVYYRKARGFIHILHIVHAAQDQSGAFRKN